MGAIHPVLFFMFVYGISLLMAIFICRTIYYSMNTEGATAETVQSGDFSQSANATALR
jgi:hypothetical protein